MLHFTVFLFFVFHLPEISLQISEREYLSMPNIFQLDDYDKCMLYEDEALYCMITFKLHPLDTKNTSKIWNTIEEVSLDVNNYRHDLLRHGICIPDTCPNITRNIQKTEEIRKGINNCYNPQFKEMGLKGEIIEMKCETNDSLYTTDFYDSLFGQFLQFYVVVILCVSLFEEIMRHCSEEKYDKMARSLLGKFVLAVSIRKNWQQLMTVDPETKDFRLVSSMQVVRVFLLVTTVLGHTITTFLAGPVLNPIYLENKPKLCFFQFELDGIFSVQLFSIMTGWLLTYHFYLDHKNGEKVGLGYLVKQFFRRYVRLTPAIAFVVAFSSTVMVHLSRGPLWHQFVGEDYKKCRETWWTNLLYINNYVDGERMCVGHTWIIATNVQLHLVGLFLLWFVSHYPKKMWCTVRSVHLLHILYLFWVIYSHNWQHSVPFLPESLYNKQYLNLQQWHTCMSSFFSNMTGLVAGMTYGYIHYHFGRREIFNKRNYTLGCWFMGCSVILTYALVDILFASENRLLNAVYGSLRRTFLAYAIGFIVLLITQEERAFIQWLTKSPTMNILGRLSYSIFIIHPIILRLQAGMNRSPSHLGNHILLKPIRDLVVMLSSAVFLVIFIEMPIFGILRCFRTKKSVKSE